MLEKLRKLAQSLREAGENELADGVCCAFAALSGQKRPQVDLTFSSVLRDLRKKSPENVRPFQKLFKEKFDEALIAEIDDPEEAALMECIGKGNFV